jgi:hypothetical protein
MWRDVANIWRKEMVTTVRDRKGMTQAILVPLIIAVFYASFTPLLNKAMFERSQKPLVIPAVGVEYADPKLLDTMHEFGITLEGYKGDLEHAVERGDEESGLVFEPGFSEDLAEERPAQARLITNSTAGGVFGGAFSDSRLQLAVSVFNQKVAAARVAARGVDPSALMPVILETEDVATPEQEGALWASFYLPILVAVVVAQGGLYQILVVKKHQVVSNADGHSPCLAIQLHALKPWPDKSLQEILPEDVVHGFDDLHGDKWPGMVRHSPEKIRALSGKGRCLEVLPQLLNPITDHFDGESGTGFGKLI